MKRLLWLYSVIAGMFCILTAASQIMQKPKETVAERFVFKYEAGRPLVYSIGLKMSTNTDIKAGTESLNTKMTSAIRYRLTLTPTANTKGGVTTMRLEPSNIEADWDITEAGNHIILSLRGSDMKGTLNGVVTIDTAKDIGTDEAQDFKKEILPLYLSGQVDLDNQGNIKQFRGDPPFVEFWTNAAATQVGLFGIVFPERPIPVGDIWQETLLLKKIDHTKIEGEGLHFTMTFTRQPDVVLEGKRIAVFNLSAPLSSKNLTGFEQQMGQNTRVNILQLDRRSTGTLRFDQERGVLIDCTTKADANGLIKTIVQGQEVTMDQKIDVDMQVNLISDKPSSVQQ